MRSFSYLLGFVDLLNRRRKTKLQSLKIKYPESSNLDQDQMWKITEVSQYNQRDDLTKFPFNTTF